MHSSEIRVAVERIVEIMIPHACDREPEAPRLHKGTGATAMLENAERTAEYNKRVQELKDQRQVLDLGSRLLAQFLSDIHTIAENSKR